MRTARVVSGGPTLPMHRGGFSKGRTPSRRSAAAGGFVRSAEASNIAFASRVFPETRTKCLSAVVLAKADQLSLSLRPRRGRGTSPGRWFRARSRCRPRRSCRRASRCNGCCRCSRGRRCCCRRSRWRWRHSYCRCRCRSAAWRHTNEIDVLFVLPSARVKIVRGRVCNIASGVIGHNGDVIAYLVLNGPAFQRSKGIAHSHVGRPVNTAIGAVGVE